jgi:hypothetical protein
MDWSALARGEWLIWLIVLAIAVRELVSVRLDLKRDRERDRELERERQAGRESPP